MELSVVEAQPRKPRRRVRAMVFHLLRVAIFVTTLVMIRWQHQAGLPRDVPSGDLVISLDDIRRVFPDAGSSKGAEFGRGQAVTAADGSELGTVMQTSPASDSIVGFSGPTNLMLGFDKDGKVAGVEVLRTKDTREHLDMILEDGRLLASWHGLTREQLSQRLADADAVRADAVSGATLTSFAMAESVARRLSKISATPTAKVTRPKSLRFPREVKVQEIVDLYPTAMQLKESEGNPAETLVLDADGQRLGHVVRTAPSTDSITGYQGPSDTLIAFDRNGHVLGLRLRESFDNDPYIGYVRDEAYFLEFFNGKSLSDLSQMDLLDEQVEGVSGATMTSMAMAEGLIVAARDAQRLEAEVTHALKQAKFENRLAAAPERQIRVTWRTWTSGCLVLGAIALGANVRLIRSKSFRRIFQLAVIVLLGIVNGDLVSQAVLVGWSQSAVPWRLAPGLVLVTSAALIVPIVSRQQPYCRHLCPHGAVQQLLINRLPWRFRMPRALHRALSALPFLLLAIIVASAMSMFPLSLVDLEPFDAWVIGVAGVASAAIAAVGLLVSAFVPMAYCRYGCPTGAVLQFLRFNGRSDRITLRDGLAFALMLAAILMRA